MAHYDMEEAIEIAEPVGDNWFFNCSKCGFAIKVEQQPD